MSTPLSAGIGTTCFPFYLDKGATPVAVWNNMGNPERHGESRYFDGTLISDLDPASGVFGIYRKAIRSI